jgi:hypothetical protein
MFGFMIGGLAVAWGVLIAFLDQAAASAGRRVDKLCTALLIWCAVVTATGGVVTAMDGW